VSDWQASDTPTQRLEAMDARIGAKADTIRAQCEAYLGYAGNNYLPFLWPLFTPHRKTFSNPPQPVPTARWSLP
jgi:hypothetical protein